MQFSLEQLLYDINNYAYVEGSVMAPDAPDHNRHMVQDVGQDGNRDRALRVLDLAHAQAAELLYPYTKTGITDTPLNDGLAEPDKWQIAMTVPDTMSQTTLNYLERLLHEWLVYKVVCDWLSITNPEKAPVWAQKIEELESEIRACVNARRGRSRIKLHPF